MPTTLFAAASALAPWRAWLQRASAFYLERHRQSPACARSHHDADRTVGRITVQRDKPGVPVAPLPPRRQSPTLRVLRVMEAGQPVALGGRMVISGRMADVCAELDRMAARAAALHPGA